MNREIKFRGLRTDGNGWIVGWLKSWKHFNGKWFERVYSIYDEEEEYLIHPESIVQFTGLKDKNGVHIYEGDIFVDTRSNGDYIDDSFIVIFKDGKFGFYNYGLFDSQFDCDYLKITGNIHENSDLFSDSIKSDE